MPPMPTPARHQHHALDIPEIITLILSFCSHHTLRIHTTLVNHQWHSLSQELIQHKQSITPFNDNSSSLPSTFASLLQKSHLLQCKGSSDIPSKDTVHNWENLHKILFQLQAETHRLNRLRTVEYRGRFELEKTVYPMLPCFGLVRTLRLLNSGGDGKLDLGIILRNCPGLTELTVLRGPFAPRRIAYSTVVHVVLEVSSVDEDEEKEGQETLPINKLRVLTLESVNVHPTTLLRIISTSPQLQALRLNYIQSLVPQQDFDLIALFTQMTKSCFWLSSLHLSFRPLNELMRKQITHSELVMALTQFLPKVTEWSFNGYDFFQLEDVPTWSKRWILHHPLQALRQLETMPNHLTSLEISGQGPPDDTLAFRESLHQFLCNSPHLLHLCARDVQMSTIYLNVDLEEAPFLPFQWTIEDSSLFRQKERKTRYRPWACRRLRTLHLQWVLPSLIIPPPVQEKDHTSLYLGANTQKDYSLNMLFGYLNRVCPLLRDLEVYHHRMVVFSNTGGLSLLIRFKDLERVMLVDSAQGPSSKREAASDVVGKFLWMRRGQGTMTDLEREEMKTLVKELKDYARVEEMILKSLAGRVRCVEPLMMMKTTEENSGLDMSGDVVCERDCDLGQEDERLGWQHYGRLWDIAQAMEGRLAKEDSMAFWPRLESFTVVWGENNTPEGKLYPKELQRLFVQRRPDVQFLVGSGGA